MSTVSDLFEKNEIEGPSAKARGHLNSEARTGYGVRADGVRLKTVALPVEHGGWGLSLEPIVLGLTLAPSISGAFLALAVMSAFLARHPLKLTVADYRRGKRFPRTPVAERFVLLYGIIAVISFIAAIKIGPLQMMWPLALAAPFACVQLVYDSLGRSRRLLPELAGSCSMAAVASSLALAGGWRPAVAFALWGVLAARVLPTIMYVRARLMLVHGRMPARTPVLVLHLAALAAVLTLAFLGLTPWLAVFAFLALLLRAVFGLSKHRQQMSAKQVGIRELCFGAMTVFAVIIGHTFRL
jgi:hypothetical protein